MEEGNIKKDWKVSIYLKKLLINFCFTVYCAMARKQYYDIKCSVLYLSVHRTKIVYYTPFKGSVCTSF